MGLTAVFAMSRRLLALAEIYDGGSRGDAARIRQTNLTEINVGDQGAYRVGRRTHLHSTEHRAGQRVGPHAHTEALTGARGLPGRVKTPPPFVCRSHSLQ